MARLIRDVIEGTGSWMASKEWAAKIERYGVSKNLDIDVVVAMNIELHTGVNARRWMKDAIVRERLTEAREAIGALNDAMVKSFWAEIEPERAVPEHTKEKK